MRWLAKTFTGLLLAATLLAVGGYFGVSYIMAEFAKLPPKPTFPNDNPDFIKKNSQKAESKNNTDKPTADKTSSAKETEKETPTPKPLPPGAFEGRVTYAEGLILRESPSRASATLGGVDMNEKVTVLEASTDGEWQRVRTSNDKEGWIRGGYVQKN